MMINCISYAQETREALSLTSSCSGDQRQRVLIAVEVKRHLPSAGWIADWRGGMGGGESGESGGLFRKNCSISFPF